MSAYDERVREVSLYLYVVTTDDVYDVVARDENEWWVSPSLNSRAMAGCGARTGDEADRWLRGAERGPYGSAGEAIESLIGESQ